MTYGGLFAYHRYEKWTSIASWFGSPDIVKLLEKSKGLEYVFLFHGNGYCRQAALQLIEGPIEVPFFVSAILYRLNDWVPQVRREALRCASRVFDRTSADVIAPAVVGLIESRLHWLRGVDEAVFLDEALSRLDVREAVAAYLLTSTSGPAQRVLRAFLRDSRLDNTLPNLAQKAVQPGVRAVALQVLLKSAACWRVGTKKAWIDRSQGRYRVVPKLDCRKIDPQRDTEAWIRIGVLDKSPQVRRLAMQALIDNPDFWILEDLIDALKIDKAPSIREGIDYVIRHRSKNY